MPYLLLLLAIGCPQRPPASRLAGPTATVVAVVDGDTLTVQLDGSRERVRLIGINTPERGECLAEEATRALQDLVGTGPVELVSDVSDRDQHGRLLRYVEVQGRSVNRELVARGLALATPYPPDVARSSVLETTQQQAEADQVGLWSPTACGASAASLAVLAIQPDGVEEEWVRIGNTGDAAVSLTGWVLKDTSASHRYRFPERTLAPGAEVTVYTGCGTDDDTHLYWCYRGGGIWNNGGDTAFLVGPNGNIASRMSY